MSDSLYTKPNGDVEFYVVNRPICFFLLGHKQLVLSAILNPNPKP